MNVRAILGECKSYFRLTFGEEQIHKLNGSPTSSLNMKRDDAKIVWRY